MPEIKITDLRFGYEKKEIFRGLSLDLKGPGIFTLTGPSGCGKTTLLRLICGLERPLAGAISLSHRPSVAFQEHRLFPELTAAENVALISREDGRLAEARTLLCAFGLSSDESELLPSELSGGMKQRVSLARAFFSDSPILIMDEPSKELDEDLRENLYRRILERGKSSLILFSTHRTEETALLQAQNITLPA